MLKRILLYLNFTIFIGNTIIKAMRRPDRLYRDSYERDNHIVVLPFSRGMLFIVELEN